MMSEATGLDVRPGDLHPAQGYWRQIRQDVHCWTATVPDPNAYGGDRRFFSWCTMTECVKFGFKLYREHGRYETPVVGWDQDKFLIHWEVSAKSETTGRKLSR